MTNDGDGCAEPPQTVEDHSARARRSKVAAAMRPGVVVVLDVGKNADEVPFAADQEPVRFQNSATGLDLGFYAARSYSLKRPPRTGRRLIRC